MDKIKLSDIDLKSLKKCKLQGTQSIVYEHDDIIVKIFNDMHTDDIKVLYKKFLEMDGLILEQALLPKSLIVENGRLIGYIMENFKNSMCLSDFYLYPRYVNCKDMFESTKKASLILRKFHDNGIIINDLSFENILINENGNIKYCDLDGCAYNNYTSPYISVLLKNLIFDYRKEKYLVTSENTDRISFMISFGSRLLSLPLT